MIDERTFKKVPQGLHLFVDSAFISRAALLSVTGSQQWIRQQTI